MKDPTLAIRKKYLQLLAGNVLLNGEVVPVYDRVPRGNPQKYVRIADQTLTESVRARSCVITEATTLLDVVTHFEGHSGGKRDSDVIADQVLDILVPDNLSASPLRTLEGFQVMSSQLDNSNILEEAIQGKFVIRRLLRLRSQIAHNEATEVIPPGGGASGRPRVKRDCDNLPAIGLGEIHLEYDCTECSIDVDLVGDIDFAPSTDQYLIFYRAGESDKPLTIHPVGFDGGGATLNQVNESVILVYNGSKWLYA